MHFATKISYKPFPGLRLKTFSILTVIVLINPYIAITQTSDNFSDGDFVSGPSWSGTANNFIVNDSYQLQLNATSAGVSWLSTTISPDFTEGVEWEFRLGQAFSPSAANHGRYYLMSDAADLSAPLNGYYLRFGQTGTEDAIELLRQSGSTSVSLCKATPGAIANPFDVRVRVTRSPNGSWILYADYTGGVNFS